MAIKEPVETLDAVPREVYAGPVVRHEAEAEQGGCCPPAARRSCCNPVDKAGCCGASSGTGCGCR